MASEPARVRIDGIDWASAFPVVRLLGAFRMAIGPTRMLPAVLLVVLMYLIGHGLDLIWGPRVLHGEFERYLALSTEDFDAWRSERSATIYASDSVRGVFEATVAAELDAFRNVHRFGAAPGLRPRRLRAAAPAPAAAACSRRCGR